MHESRFTYECLQYFFVDVCSVGISVLRLERSSLLHLVVTPHEADDLLVSVHGVFVVLEPHLHSLATYKTKYSTVQDRYVNSSEIRAHSDYLTKP